MSAYFEPDAAWAVGGLTCEWRPLRCGLCFDSGGGLPVEVEKMLGLHVSHLGGNAIYYDARTSVTGISALTIISS